jgi:hypothetical protein
MVISNLKGGLGNYLFQIAAGYSLAIDNNDSFTIDERMILQVHSHWSVYSTNIFRNVPITNGVINFNYYKYESLKHQLIPYVDNILIDGYFQSEKYWKGNEDKILELFKIDENTLEYLTQKYPDIIGADDTCSIHVRRGDFLKIGFYNKLDMSNYYEKAIQEIGADKHFVIFSNDIEWCKENFKGIKATFVKSKLDFMDLYLMSLCKDNITANSTFSWWGSYLNMNPNKRVVTPATWFIHTHPNEDIIPESWIKI